VKIERTITIDAPAQNVYEVVMNPHRLEEWVTIHHHLEDAPRGLLKQGSKLTQSLKLAGRGFKVRWTVVENRPCERVVWEGRGPVGSHARVEYAFKPDGTSTRFSYTNQYDLPGGVLGRVAGGAVSRITAKELDGSLAKLKRLVE
jgi:uncharacterized membrane protein